MNLTNTRMYAKRDLNRLGEVHGIMDQHGSLPSRDEDSDSGLSSDEEEPSQQPHSGTIELGKRSNTTAPTTSVTATPTAKGGGFTTVSGQRNPLTAISSTSTTVAVSTSKVSKFKEKKNAAAAISAAKKSKPSFRNTVPDYFPSNNGSDEDDEFS
jgi:hypothetical protein